MQVNKIKRFIYIPINFGYMVLVAIYLATAEGKTPPINAGGSIAHKQQAEIPASF
jgi:hypothetical protein